jgi:hypothetical protein
MESLDKLRIKLDKIVNEIIVSLKEKIKDEVDDYVSEVEKGSMYQIWDADDVIDLMKEGDFWIELEEKNPFDDLDREHDGIWLDWNDLVVGVIYQMFEEYRETDWSVMIAEDRSH